MVCGSRARVRLFAAHADAYLWYVGRGHEFPYLQRMLMRTSGMWHRYNYVPPPDKRHVFTNATEDALHLLNCLLTYDPNRRISARDALNHRYFRTSPSPCPIDQLPRPAPKQKAKEKENSTSPSTLQRWASLQLVTSNPLNPSRWMQSDDCTTCGNQTCNHLLPAFK